MCRRIFVIGLVILAGLSGQSEAGAQTLSLDPAKAPTQYVLEAWQDDEGLPQSTVSAITQTRDGYLWLGTQEGLVRFNGMRFTVFDKRNTPAFAASHNIRALHEDADGTLWIGTFGGGLVRYTDGVFARHNGVSGAEISAVTSDLENTLWIGTFDAGLFAIRTDSLATRLTHFTTDDGLASPFISTVHADREGVLWVGTRAGLHRIDGGTITLLTRTDGLSDDYIQEVFTDAGGSLWISTRGGLDRYHDGAVLAGGPAPPFGQATVQTFLEDRAGSLWIGTDGGGLARYRAGRFETLTQEDGLSHNSVAALYEDQEGSLWIGTDGGGLNRLRDDKFTPWTTREGLPTDIVFPLYEDAEGALWIGSEHDGLTRFRDGTFTHYTTADGLSHNAVYSLADDGAGTLWVGTYGGGLNRFRDGTFTHYTTDDGLAHDAISVLYDDGAGTLWIGTDGGLSRLKNGQFTTLAPDDGLASPYVLALKQDRHGALWIGTYGGGLQRLHDGAFTAHYTTEAGSWGDGLGADVVVDLHEDDDGTLWIGTYGGGLSRLRDGMLTTFTIQNGLFSDTIYRILEDAHGSLWMSCNNGIFRVRKADLDAFAEGRLATIPSVAYGKADGLKSPEMNGGFQPAGWKDRAGRLWFPSIQGLAMIDPERLHLNETPPPVVIESVVVDKEHLPPGIEAELAPGKGKIEFHFGALSFVDHERIVYKYRLDGYEHAWSEATDTPAATYTNLPPGHYTFRVLARNRDGVWNETGAAFSFRLRPFFHQTYWFWLVVVLGVGLAVFGVHRLRISHLKTRQRELEQAIDERTEDLREAKDKIEMQAEELTVLNGHLEMKVQEQFQQMVIERHTYEQQLIAEKERAEMSERLKSAILDNINHEFRTPLTGILGYAQVLGMEAASPLQKEFVEHIEVNGKRLMRSLNAILDLSNLEARLVEVKQQRIDLVETARTALALFEPMAQQKGLTLRIEHAAPAVYALADEQAVERVLNHLADNAIKFTDAGEVVVRVAEEGGRALLQVHDTGIGISEAFLPSLFEAFTQESDGLDRAHEGAGLGLAITHHFVQLLGGTIAVETEKEVGSTFTVSLLAASHAEDAAPATASPPLRLPLRSVPRGSTLARPRYSSNRAG